MQCGIAIKKNSLQETLREAVPKEDGATEAINLESNVNTATNY